MLLPQGKKPHWQRLLREAARSAGSCIQSHFALHSYPIVSVANHQISYDVVTSWSPCSATTGPTGCSRNGTLAFPAPPHCRKEGSYEVFEKCPLDPRLIQYCMQDVALMFELELAMRRRIPRRINDFEAFIVRESAGTFTDRII